MDKFRGRLGWSINKRHDRGTQPPGQHLFFALSRVESTTTTLADRQLQQQTAGQVIQLHFLAIAINIIYAIVTLSSFGDTKISHSTRRLVSSPSRLSGNPIVASPHLVVSLTRAE